MWERMGKKDEEGRGREEEQELIMETELRLIEKHITGAYSYNRWAQTWIKLSNSQYEKINLVTDRTPSDHII